jgi:hypothetical protein
MVYFLSTYKTAIDPKPSLPVARSHQRLFVFLWLEANVLQSFYYQAGYDRCRADTNHSRPSDSVIPSA